MDMSFSNDNVTFGPWQPVAGSAAYTLPAGEARHTVFVKYRNAAGGVSSAASASITLDTVAPSTTASLSATNNGCGILLAGPGHTHRQRCHQRRREHLPPGGTATRCRSTPVLSPSPRLEATR